MKSVKENVLEKVYTIRDMNKALKEKEKSVREDCEKDIEFRENVIEKLEDKLKDCEKEKIMMEADMEKIRIFSELAERSRIAKEIGGLKDKHKKESGCSDPESLKCECYYGQAIKDALKILEEE